MVGKNIHQLLKLIAFLLKIVWLKLKAKSNVVGLMHRANARAFFLPYL
jgi:hypothetical protein